MGHGSSNISRDFTVEQQATFDNFLTESHNVMNNITSSLVQTTVTNVTSGKVINQNISFLHLRAKGDIKITDITQKTDSKINLSVLADSTIKEDLVKELTQKLQTQVKNLTTSTQEQLDKNNEEVFSQAFGMVGDMMGSLGSDLTGSDYNYSQDTTLQELMGVDNETTLDSNIEDAITTDIVSDLMTDMSSSFIGTQKINFEDVRSDEGEIVVSNITNDLIESTIMSVVTTSGISNTIISKFTSISKAKMDSVSKSDAKLEEEKVGTWKGISGIVDSAGNAAAKVMASGLLAIFLPILVIVVIGGVVVFAFIYAFKGSGGKMLKKYIDNDDSDTQDSDKDDEEKEGTVTTQIGDGENKYNTEKYFNKLKNYLIKDLTVLDFVLMVIIFFAIIVIFKDVFRLLTSYEHFEEDSYMRLDDKYFVDDTAESKPPSGITKNMNDAIKLQFQIYAKQHLMIIRWAKDPGSMIRHKSKGRLSDYMLFRYFNKEKYFGFSQYDPTNKHSFAFAYETSKNGGYFIRSAGHDTKAWITISKEGKLVAGPKSKASRINFHPSSEYNADFDDIIE